MKKIYLAGPYSHKDPSVRVERFETLSRIAGQLMYRGHNVYSPISHSHPIVLAVEGTPHELPHAWEFWEKIDRYFIEWADEVHVAMIPGFDKSVGVNAEIKIANELGKPVFWIAV